MHYELPCGRSIFVYPSVQGLTSAVIWARKLLVCIQISLSCMMLRRRKWSSSERSIGMRPGENASSWYTSSSATRLCSGFQLESIDRWMTRSPSERYYVCF